MIARAGSLLVAAVALVLVWAGPVAPVVADEAAVEKVVTTLSDDGDHLTFHNTGTTPLTLRHGAPETYLDDPDGVIALDPAEESTIDVRRPVVAWHALEEDGSSAGDGEVANGRSGLPPETRDDVKRLNGNPASGAYNLDRAYVLANDLDPDRDPLEICGVAAPRQLTVSIRVDRTPGLFYLSVSPNRNRSGRYVVTYDVCDGQWQSAGTLTVVVTRVEPVRVAVGKRPGRLRFKNLNSAEILVSYGRAGPRRHTERDGGFALAPGAKRTVRVTRKRIAYRAVMSPGHSAGKGVVRHIRLPRGR